MSRFEDLRFLHRRQTGEEENQRETRVRFKQAFIKISGATVVAQFAALAASPILSRLYSPYDFGVAAVFTALLSVLSIVGTLRFELSIPAAGDDAEAKGIRNVAFLLSSTFGFSLFLLLVFYPQDFVPRSLIGVWPYRWFLPPLIVLACFYQALYHSAIRERQYATLVRCRLSQTILGTLAALLLGFAISGPVGLLAGSALSSTAGVYYLWLRRGALSELSFSSFWRIWEKKRAFGAYATASAILNSSGTILPSILLPALYGEEVTGSFSLAVRIIGMPMILVGAIVGQIALSEGSALQKENPSALPQFFRSITRRLTVVSVLVLMVGLFSPLIFDEILGKQWYQSGVFAGILSLSAAAQIIVAPLSQIVFILNKTRVQFFLDLVRAPAVTLSLSIPFAFGLDAPVAIAAFSITMLVHYGISFSVYQRIVRAASSSPYTR